MNDIQAHQTSVDTLNDAGRQLIETGKNTAEASATQEKLALLNRHWRDLLQKTADRQQELEDALREAQRFHAEIQDLLSWLGEVDGIIAASKPVGGLPETATEQLERFMVSGWGSFTWGVVKCCLVFSSKLLNAYISLLVCHLYVHSY